MIPVYSSALKDNEVNVTDLPMPRILGEDEPQPILVWAFSGMTSIVEPIDPARLPDGDGSWISCYTSRQAALNDPENIPFEEPFRTTLDERMAMAKREGDEGVILIDESYTVIETWRVG